MAGQIFFPDFAPDDPALLLDFPPALSLNAPLTVWTVIVCTILVFVFNVVTMVPSFYFAMRWFYPDHDNSAAVLLQGWPWRCSCEHLSHRDFVIHPMWGVIFIFLNRTYETIIGVLAMISFMAPAFDMEPSANYDFKFVMAMSFVLFPLSSGLLVVYKSVKLFGGEDDGFGGSCVGMTSKVWSYARCKVPHKTNPLLHSALMVLAELIVFGFVPLPYTIPFDIFSLHLEDNQELINEAFKMLFDSMVMEAVILAWFGAVACLYCCVSCQDHDDSDVRSFSPLLVCGMLPPLIFGIILKVKNILFVFVLFDNFSVTFMVGRIMLEVGDLLEFMISFMYLSGAFSSREARAAQERRRSAKYDMADLELYTDDGQKAIDFARDGMQGQAEDRIGRHADDTRHRTVTDVGPQDGQDDFSVGVSVPAWRQRARDNDYGE